MKTRIIHTRFWKDEYISKLSHKEQLLFIYLLTNEHVNMCGTYELPDKYICVDLNLTQKELSAFKERLQGDGKFYFSQGWVRILKHEKYNTYGKGKQEIALAKEKELIPEFMSDTSIDTSMDTSMHTRPKSKTINNNIYTTPKKSSSLKATPLTEQDLEDLATSQKVPLSKIQATYKKVLNFEPNRKLGPYKDYRAAIRTFLDNEYQWRMERGEEFI